MKRIILTTIASIFLCNVSFAQTPVLDKLPEAERNKILIEIAKETVMKYGSDYYRNIKPPVIERRVVTNEAHDVTMEETKLYLNRVFYTVEYPYDKTKESFSLNYSVKTYIWADTGIAFQLMFGNAWGIALDKEPITRSVNGPPAATPFKHQPPYKREVKSYISEEPEYLFNPTTGEITGVIPAGTMIVAEEM